jgi:quercetin dioxygenase-like cupin family protein
MIRCVRLFTTKEGTSSFEEGFLMLSPSERGDVSSVQMAVASVIFQETGTGGQFDWHDAPRRQLVITLSGVLEFEMQDGECVRIFPGDIILAEDTTGSGHRWRIVDGNPWRRAYIVLNDEIEPSFFVKKVDIH